MTRTDDSYGKTGVGEEKQNGASKIKFVFWEASSGSTVFPTLAEWLLLLIVELALHWIEINILLNKCLGKIQKRLKKM